jgi:hypothetical protein
MPLYFHRDSTEVHLELELAQRDGWMFSLNCQPRATLHSPDKFFHYHERKEFSVMARYFLNNTI